MKQRTIKNSVRYSGIGLHTGNQTTLEFKPALPDTGIRFVRTDLNPPVEIKADVDHVVDTVRGTTIGTDNVIVHTVEHVLAAVAGLGIDNLIIELNANEPPVGDGSSIPFVETLRQAVVIDQDVPKKYFSVDEPIWVTCGGGTYLVILPDKDFRISYTVDYNHPILKSQYETFNFSDGVFEREIASARTFCFLHEVEMLQKQGLIKGGSLDNAVVIGDDTILNDQLRYPTEFVRHKILDLVGDLYLLGQPVKGHLVAVKSGHSANVAFVKRLRQYATERANGKSVSTPQTIKPKITSKTLELPLEAQQIQNILPHRYPFLFVDRIIELDDDRIAIGLKNVSINEFFFEGHFPGHPIMPGVLIVEAMAQVAGVLMLHKTENHGKLAYLLGIDNAKFRKKVVPGDQLRFKAEIKKIKGKTGKVQGYAYVDDKIVAEAELTFSLVEP